MVTTHIAIILSCIIAVILMLTLLTYHAMQRADHLVRTTWIRPYDEIPYMNTFPDDQDD